MKIRILCGTIADFTPDHWDWGCGFGDSGYGDLTHPHLYFGDGSGSGWQNDNGLTSND